MRQRIVLAVLAMLVALPAAAQDDPKTKATELAKQGAELARNGQYAEAASKFQESINVFPMVDVYYNLAYSYEQLGQWEGCVQNYTKYIEVYKAEHSSADPPEIISVRRSIDKCTETVQPPITITTEPPGAQVALGAKDKILGATPLTQKLPPGTYQIFITKQDFTTVEAQIVVRKNEAGKFHFDLAKLTNTGKVRIVVNVKEATIYIDGKNYGISPYLETPELDAGAHQIVIKKERYGSINQPFEIQKDKTTELRYEIFIIDPPPSWRSYLGWAGVSIGVVCIAGGIVAYKFADDVFNDSPEYDQRVLLQNIGYGVGGGLLGIGTALLIWEAFSDSVDKADLIDVGALPLDLGVTPTRDGVFFNGTVRF